MVDVPPVRWWMCPLIFARHRALQGIIGSHHLAFSSMGIRRMALWADINGADGGGDYDFLARPTQWSGGTAFG
jgi:hypothetical protein